MLHSIRRAIAALAAVAVAPALIATLSAQAPESGGSAAVVKKAFEQAYPGATIAAIRQERDGARTLHRVEGMAGGRRRIMLYDGTGRPIETAEEVGEKDLPGPVAAAMRSHRRAIYVSGFKVTRGGNVEYRLTLRGTRKTAMVAKPDGTVISFK